MRAYRARRREIDADKEVTWQRLLAAERRAERAEAECAEVNDRLDRALRSLNNLRADRDRLREVPADAQRHLKRPGSESAPRGAAQVTNARRSSKDATRSLSRAERRRLNRERGRGRA